MSIVVPFRPKRPDGDEPPGGDDMEKRVAALETAFTSVKGSIDELKVETVNVGMKVAGVANDVSKLPDKDWVHNRAWGLIAAMAALLGIFKYLLPG